MASQPDETAIGGDRRTFRSTLWTVVLKARDPSAPDRRDALQTLIETYWKPVYFFIRRKGGDPEASKDLAQGFFAALLERNYLQYVDRGRGKFRTFLLTALEHFLADEVDRARAQKRGGGRALLSLDFAQAESEASRQPVSDETPDRAFQRDWALRVMAQGLKTLRDEFASSGRLEEFEAFRLHLSYAAAEAPSYADVGRRLGITEDEVRTRIHRARGRYREAILEVVRSYTESEEDARDELRELFAAFA